VFVVAENLVWTTRIENGQLVDTAQDFLQLACENLSPALAPETVQAFFQGLLNGTGQGFSGLRGNLASQALCLHTLDTKGHNR
jgi:hypothetical protein